MIQPHLTITRGSGLPGLVRWRGIPLIHPDDGFVGLVRVSDGVGGYLNPIGSFANGPTVFGGAFDMRRIGELHNEMNVEYLQLYTLRRPGSK